MSSFLCQLCRFFRLLRFYVEQILLVPTIVNGPGPGPIFEQIRKSQKAEIEYLAIFGRISHIIPSLFMTVFQQVFLLILALSILIMEKAIHMYFHIKNL